MAQNDFETFCDKVPSKILGFKMKFLFSDLNVPVVWSIMQFTELVIICLGCQKTYNNPILWKIE